tara:strand:+ start:8109 stop:8267 length:159 start_codon:yes stop_codon:yes gene_type:complete
MKMFDFIPTVFVSALGALYVAENTLRGLAKGVIQDRKEPCDYDQEEARGCDE